MPGVDRGRADWIEMWASLPTLLKLSEKEKEPEYLASIALGLGRFPNSKEAKAQLEALSEHKSLVVSRAANKAIVGELR